MELSREWPKKNHMWLWGVCSFLICANAFADDCGTINDNPAWNNGMTQLSGQMKNKQWDDAYKTAETLNAICERSPQLNYAMGIIQKEKGDDTKALYYMQRATRFTEEFAVKGDTLEKMWAGRYEAEHPEARPDQIAKRQKELEESKKQVDALTKENIKLKGDVSTAALGSKLETFEDDEAERRHYAAGLWTSVGLAGVGLALTVAGGVLAAINRKGIDFNENKAWVKADYTTYWTLLGSGIGALVTGTVLTGIFGYYYSHSVSADNNPSSVSLYVTPTGIGMQF